MLQGSADAKSQQLRTHWHEQTGAMSQATNIGRGIQAGKREDLIVGGQRLPVTQLLLSNTAASNADS